jgi:uncharacterized protein (DUF433 family)
MPTPTRTLRLKPHLRAEIERIARRTRRSFSEVTQDLLEEAVRMREAPGIHFADEPAGREAKVTGTGLGVWEVVSMYRAAGDDVRRLRARRPDLLEVQIKAALTYYERHRNEIDSLIDENETLHATRKAAQDRAGRRR